MRKLENSIFTQQCRLVLLIIISFCSYGVSQEEASLEESLNLVVTEIHKPKFNKTPSAAGGSATIDESELNYKYYDSGDEWMEVSFRYTLEDWRNEGEGKVTREDLKRNPIVPEVAFRISIEGLAKSTKKEEKDVLNVLLTGEAKYINVKKTNSSQKYRYGVFYVSPEIVELYDLKSLHSSGKGNIRVEAFIGEKKALKGKDLDESYKDLKEKDESWEKTFKSMNLVSGVVFTKDLTPWAMSGSDRFPMLKPKDHKSAGKSEK